MADVSDVEAALALCVTAAIYPAGDMGAGEFSTSVTGKPVRVYRGWPVSGALDLDLAAGIANVSVFAVPGATRNTTRWGPVATTTQAAPTLSVEVLGNTATFSGAGGVGQLAGVLVGGQAFVYRGQAGDTPALVAAVLAESVRAVRACWLSGATISVPGVTQIIARVTCDASVLTEWSRQEQAVRVTAWCPDPATRDVVCATIGGVLAATSFLPLADGSGGRVRYRSTSSMDDGQDAQLYRRDLVYDVEYATGLVTSAPSMLFGDLQLDGGTIYG